MTGAGCVPRPSIEIANRTGKPIAIVSADKRYSATPGQAVSFPYPTGWVNVDIDGEKVFYGAPMWDQAYLKTGFFGATIRCEIYSDARIYIVKPNDPLPDDPTEYPQPDGFPLIPHAEVQ